MVKFQTGWNNMGKILQVENIQKSFGNTKVLNGLSLAIDEGKFVSILGASGSGKTTLLRIIAGIESADSGRVILNDRDITNLPPEKRHLSMVFQNYALFEHMTVADNIGYSLKIARVPKAERRKRVEEMLEKISLPGYGNRMPDELSGGQRQRVALARSIISAPMMILLDEPLAALDAALRKRMRSELKNLQNELGITFLYITHDLSTAYYVSDEIVTLYRGRMVESGPATLLMDEPLHPYTEMLMNAVPKLGDKWNDSAVLPDMEEKEYGLAGCRFAPRCPYATDRCKNENPPELEPVPGRKVKCFTPLKHQPDVGA